MITNSYPLENKDKKLKSSVYTTTFSTRAPILNHVSTLIKKENTHTFICASSLNSFTSSLKESDVFTFKHNLNTDCKNIFFNKNKGSNSLNHVYNDIKELHIKKNTSVIIIIPDSMLATNLKHKAVVFFEQLKQFAIDNKLTINLLIYGRDIHLIKKLLSQRPDLCVGYSTLQNIDKNTYLYHVYYWGLDSGMKSESETYLTLSNENSLVVQSKINTDQPTTLLNIDDESAIYISKTAIENNQKIVDTMICSPTNEELDRHLSGVSRATIVFSCSKQDEVRQLGVRIYLLRKRFGQNIKIIVREMHSCLRYSDEMYLLQSGINLIVHFGTRFSSVLSSIEILRGQVLTRPLPSTTEELLNFSFQTTEIKGYINNDAFINYTRELLKHFDVAQTEFALIKLEILPNIKPHSYLSMCNIQREGDVMTLCHDAIYLFLQGVRMSDLPIALHNIFTLPIRDIFSSQTSFTTSGRVEHELPNILEHRVSIDDELTPTDNAPYTSSASSAQLILAQHKPLEF
ncbi:cellulose biosynthesis protein BcsE [Aliivibrio logei]|uniref:Cellulose biosynthesis protein BcsE n=1 Tax=Aliivibrio logei 5S-186 TaxID=626086 RepID=A0ABX3B010_ALILO|nr:cellulose biosynthesis protein BcsE [Aliivibrio logei]OEF22514.1 cellulose biosynthesis protein BcsE [Aliivibrio logei 5S-186]